MRFLASIKITILISARIPGLYTSPSHFGDQTNANARYAHPMKQKKKRRKIAHIHIPLLKFSAIVALFRPVHAYTHTVLHTANGGKQTAHIGVGGGGKVKSEF